MSRRNRPRKPPPAALAAGGGLFYGGLMAVPSKVAWA